MIFGESAGGESVKQLLANPPKPLPFSSVILESQNAVLPGNGLLNYKQVLLYFGCANVDCLRKIPAVDIKAYIESQSLSFPPVNNDGTSTPDVRLSISSGKFANVPTMLGSNLNEARVFLAVAGLTDGSAAVDSFFDQYNITSQAVRDSIIAAYAAQGITNLYELADRIGTDLVFTCTTARLANYLATFGRTTYRYLFTPTFPSISIFANPGAYHTAEIPEVFGTYPLSNEFGTATQQQIQLSAFMQKTWANFAKNPTGGIGWPKVGSASGKELGVLGKDGSSGVTIRPLLEADYACPLYAGIEDVLGFSFK
jgi:carboxylesterase type B